MARALRLIDAEGADLPLATLAARLGMSPAHFHRVFSAWVGVSPKRYQQYLALGHARTLLATRHSVLDAALGAGLSGSGRLHDLFLSWEAMRPGEFARGGAGLAIDWGWFPSPFGPALVMATDRGICGIGFAGETGAEATLDDLRSRWPRASYREDPDRLRPWATAAFAPRPGAGGAETPLVLIGAPFQIKVWEALLAVPAGHVTTYGDIADAIGAPRAARAVGTAVGRNPISWLIPCHRALRQGGALGGYHWGLPVKRAMLALESARADARAAA
ncbi:MAG: methylated-DNA--[protein]-cysteine S-methyltransferase [Rhodobacteraceae bacterium]|nr:methylated-DNA--[protein]-cysteine S-methyltransferase [Paracoccaceae bacterium]